MTIKQWYENAKAENPDDAQVWGWAIENAIKAWSENDTASSLTEALRKGFVWNAAPHPADLRRVEKHNFWAAFYNEIKQKENE